MTPPDSDGPRVYRPGDPEYFHATPPDSDAREATRLSIYEDGKYLPAVLVPLSLAQRILAALEHGWMREQDPHDLARELRAVIGK